MKSSYFTLAFVTLILCNINTVKAQDILNNFKYVIVPAQFEFQSEPNQYDINKLMVFLFEKNGMKAYINNEVLPADINRGECNAVNLEIEKKSFLSVNTTLIFKDCQGKIIYQTKKGSSTTKDYRKGYHEAIRDAYSDMENYQYEYVQTVAQAAPITGELDETIVEFVGELEIENEPETLIEEEIVELQEIMPTKFLYKSINTKHALQESNVGYNIYNGDISIGTLQKISEEHYIAAVGSNKGVAFFKGDFIVVEYKENGELVKLVFEPVK